MLNVFAIPADRCVEVDNSSSEGHTGETLEFALDIRASVLQLSLVEILILTVETGVEDLEPDVVALAAESRRDVVAVAAVVVVVAVDVAVTVIRALHHDGELRVRLQAASWERVEMAENSCVGAELEDDVVSVAQSC